MVIYTGDCVGIIVVSDVHLGYMSRDKTQSLSNRDDFNRFLDNALDADDIDKFVICGDLLDMWRRDISGVVVENAETSINKPTELLKIIYAQRIQKAGYDR